MTTTVRSLKSILDEMLEDIKYDVDDLGLYPFFVRVGVVKYRPPRHEFFKYFRHIGLAHIDPILYHKEFNMPSHLTFIFPERHLSVHEQQHFMHRIVHHPQVGEIKTFDMITSSAIMVSDFMTDMLRILTWPEDEGVVIPLDMN
jgi:hypothetical protein